MMHQLIDKKNKIIIYFIFLIILSSVTNKSLENQDSSFIKIKKINVSGLSNNNNLKIKKKLSELLSKNIFLINKENIKKKIVQYNLVEEYNIKKIYPNQIDIKIKQTKFIAKIKKKNYFLIGSNGKLISNEYTNETLPFFFGKFNSERFLRFKEIVNNSEFKFKNFKSIFFYSSNRWDVQTNDDVLIKLPEKNLLKALKVAHKIINNNKFEDRRVIDLRISNHIIMQ
jgi:cell division protein FtsQ